MGKKERGAAVFVVLLLAVSLARLFLLSAQPLNDDSAVYAEMVRETIENPAQIIPHYLGNPVSWKPSAAFYLYAPATAIFSAALPALPMEMAFRFGPALASIACAFVLFGIGRRLFGAQEGFISAVIFLTANETLAVANLMLLDTALLLFVLLALYSYMRSLEDRRWLAAAFIFSALAALTKTYVALLAPLLGIAYYYSFAPRSLRKPAFVASLLAVPLAMLAYAALFSLMVPDGFRDIVSAYVYDAIARIFVSGPGLLYNVLDAAKFMFPWSLFAPAGIALLSLRKAEDRFLLVWACLAAIPILGAKGYFWYYLVAVPPLALLSVRALSMLKPQHLTAALLLCLLLSFANCGELVTDLFEVNGDQAAAGMFLARECESTLLISERGIPAVTFYKFSSGGCRDYSSLRQMVAEPYGIESYVAAKTMWEIVFDRVERNSLANATPEYLHSLMSGYGTVVMEKRFYGIYEKEPLPGYSEVFFSPHGDFAVLRRAQ